MVAEFDQLADLAAAIRSQPVGGVPAYKPPNSDPAGDMYLMDFLGMLGIPLVPVHEFPATAPVIFLPAQAATDPHLVDRMRTAQARGARLILTTNLLTVAPQTRQFARHAVHAAMAGKTDMLVGLWFNCFTNVPIELAVSQAKQVDPESELWRAVLATTGQPVRFTAP